MTQTAWIRGTPRLCKNYFEMSFKLQGYRKGEDHMVYHVVVVSSVASLPPFCLIPAATFIKISPVLSSTLTG